MGLGFIKRPEHSKVKTFPPSAVTLTSAGGGSCVRERHASTVLCRFPIESCRNRSFTKHGFIPSGFMKGADSALLKQEEKSVH